MRNLSLAEFFFFSFFCLGYASAGEFYLQGQTAGGLGLYYTASPGASGDRWRHSGLIRTLEMQFFSTDRIGFRIAFRSFKDSKPDPSPGDWAFLDMNCSGLSVLWNFSGNETFWSYLSLFGGFYKGRLTDNYIGKSKMASDFGFTVLLGIEHMLNDSWSIANEIGWRILKLRFENEPVYSMNGLVFGASFHYYFGGF